MIAFQPISYATLLLMYTSNLYHVLSIGNNWWYGTTEENWKWCALPFCRILKRNI
jgi:hypothetical protein